MLEKLALFFEENRIINKDLDSSIAELRALNVKISELRKIQSRLTRGKRPREEDSEVISPRKTRRITKGVFKGVSDEEKNENDIDIHHSSEKESEYDDESSGVIGFDIEETSAYIYSDSSEEVIEVSHDKNHFSLSAGYDFDQDSSDLIVNKEISSEKKKKRRKSKKRRKIRRKSSSSKKSSKSKKHESKDETSLSPEEEKKARELYLKSIVEAEALKDALLKKDNIITDLQSQIIQLSDQLQQEKDLFNLEMEKMNRKIEEWEQDKHIIAQKDNIIANLQRKNKETQALQIYSARLAERNEEYYKNRISQLEGTIRELIQNSEFKKSDTP
eukprot:TRINITY_DN11084_c0_g1_i1.p1 TRINITY_DN11084_c0_g1~~TRINITY_DN11084_c0_g1_i1.p1  ORF type:complete len:331 (-),score=81.62 TRINITY_DN11084_c0_g1_i1:39-1031(-)